MVEKVTQAPLATFNILCNYCHTLGHIEKSCYQKDTAIRTVKPKNSDTLQTVKMVTSPQLQQIISFDGNHTIFEIDTCAGDSFF